MFSPYYARARRRTPDGAADPADHCALNVALYGTDGAGSRWAMTERGRSALHRDATRLQIGPSALHWDGDALHIEIDEVTVPWPSRLRGHVTVHATARADHAVALTDRHRWCPIAPRARVEVALGALRWSGPGYLDSNRGDEPLERAFRGWHWARAPLADGGSIVHYDVDRRDAEAVRFALRFDAQGRAEPIALPPPAPLPRSRWGIARIARADADAPATLRQTLTDAPFYARSVLDARWAGERVTAVHESLSLDRFDTAWVQAMLPFRMPRRASGPAFGRRR